MPGQFVGPRQAILYGNVRIPYLLYDAFLDTRAAGAVNGTLSTPPDTIALNNAASARTVTDTNSKLSIANGVANFATGGGAGVGDPGIWYASLAAHTLGRVFLARVVLGDVSGASFQFGFDDNTSGTANGSLAGNAAGSLRFSPGGIAVGVITATTYDLALVMKATGLYAFIKGGTFTNWSLVWIDSLDTRLIPAIGANGPASIYTADNVRIPTSLYIPIPLAYDTFTRADAALGNSETVGPDGASQVVTARAWTGTTFTISTNKAINTPTLGADVIVNGGFGTDTDWNKGAGWSIAAGVAAAVTASSDLTAAVAPLVVGTWYSVTYTLSGFGAGTVNAKLGSTAFPTHAANATYTETGLALTTAFAFTGVGFTGSIDDVSCKPLTLSELFATMAPGIADVMLDINCTMVSATGAGKQIGIVSNLDSAATPANFRLTILDGRGNVVVYDCIAGAYTVKATTAITYSAAAPLRVVLSGTALSRFYNNSLVGSTQTMAANTNALAGIFSTSPLSSQDIWQTFAVGTSNGAYFGLSAL